MNSNKIISSIIFSICFYFLGFAQKKNAFQIPDSLKNVNYEELKIKYAENESDKQKAILYANVYLLKAKKEKSRENIAYGYLLLGYNDRFSDIQLKYIDSILFLTKDHNDKYFPSLAYFEIGSNYFVLGLDSFIYQ